MNLERKENNELLVTGTVNKEEFEKSLNYAFDRIKDKVEIKGFRKGKISRSVFEKHYGVESLYDEAINHALNQKYVEVASVRENNVVGFRKVDIDQETLSVEGFSFTMVLVVKPEVELGKYAGLKVRKADTEVKAEEVEREINQLLTKDAVLENKESDVLENGDTAIFDFEGFDNGVPFEGGKAENYQLEIGSNQFIPGFEEQMVGMKVEEERELNVTFPEQYHAENLKGKPVVFKVKLHEIKVKTKKELNDEFVKSLNRANVNTVEELENSIKESIQKAKEQSETNRVKDELVNLACEFANVNIPQEMLDQQKEEFRNQVTNQAKQYQMDLDTFLMLTGSSKEKFEEEIQKASEARVKSLLVIEAIAKKENIQASEEQLEEKYNELSKMYNMEVSKIKGLIAKENLEEEVIFNNTIKFLVENADFE
jgi:trigger factor